jgi:hypothetical protein
MSLPLHLKRSKEFFKYSKKIKWYSLLYGKPMEYTSIVLTSVNLVSQDATLWNIFYHLGGK